MYAQCLKHQVMVRRIILLENGKNVTVMAVNEKAPVLPFNKTGRKIHPVPFLKVKTKTAHLPVGTNARKDESQHPDASEPIEQFD